MNKTLTAAVAVVSLAAGGWWATSGGGASVSATSHGQAAAGAGTITYQRAPMTRSGHGSTEWAPSGTTLMSWEDGNYRAITPCRVIDTRSTSAGALRANTSRAFYMIDKGGFTAQGGDSSDCGIPESATSVHVNVTSAGATGNGNIRVYPYGEAAPLASLVNFRTGVPVANAATIALCRNASGTLCDKDVRFLSTVPTDLVVDVMGYYEPPMVAQVNGDGTVYGNSMRLVSVSDQGVGEYEVIWDTDVSACLASISLGDGFTGGGDVGIVAAVDRFGEPAGLWIETYDATGSAADRPFQVHMVC